MKLRQFAAVTFLTCLVSFASSAGIITSFSPEYGAPGDYIDIYGGGFDQGTLTVRFNNTKATEVYLSSSIQIKARVPAGATTGLISVQLGSTPAVYSTNKFTVIGPGPYIGSFSPNVGFGPVNGGRGTTVTIQGAHLETVTNVYFGTKKGDNLNVSSYTSIQADVPTGATSGKISLRSPLGTSTSEADFYVPPVISKVSPLQGRPGTEVLINGVNFLGTYSVTLNDTQAQFQVWSNTGLTMIVPPLARSGKICVYAPAASFETNMNFKVLPTITGVSPGFGSPGASVVITGANFTNLNKSVATSVKFNNVTASYSQLSFDRLVAVVPPNATTGPISIQTSEGGYTNASPFYVTARITSFTPTNSLPGSRVRINGTNFTGATEVSFAGVPSISFTVTNNNIIGAVVPTNVISGPISVTTPAGTAASASYFYGIPLVTGFSPTHGLPGNVIEVTGTNFLDAKAVLFNGLPAPWHTTTNNGVLFATVPTGAQAGRISVVSPAGTNSSAASFILDYVDLGLTLTTSPSMFFIGSNTFFVFGITNSGPADAPNSVLTNTVPAGATLLSFSTSQGTLSTNASGLRVDLGLLPAGSAATVTQQYRFASAGKFTMYAGLFSGYLEVAPANNSTALEGFVHPPAILTMQKLVDQTQLSWPLSLSNFVLQHCFSMSPTNWIGTPAKKQFTATETLVIDTNIAEQKFYRLKSPSN